MDIYKALNENQESICKKMEALLSLDSSTNKANDLVDEISEELMAHTRAEDATFYNSLRLIKPLEELSKSSYHEHKKIETLLHSLQIEIRMELPWKSSADKLYAAFIRHVAHEKNRVFPSAKLYLRASEAREMGRAYRKLKKEIQKEHMMQTTLELIANVALESVANSFRRYTYN